MMNFQMCGYICQLNNSTYFGVQNGFFNLNKILYFHFYKIFINSTECFCDNQYGTYNVVTSDQVCNVTCSGMSTQICGGISQNSVYTTIKCK